MLKEDKLAEEWLDKRYLKDMGVRKPCKEAFLAGLKAGKGIAEVDIATIAYKQGAEQYKTKWHKVADSDIPKENKIYLVEIKDNGLAIAYFNGLHWETRYNLGDSGHCVETVIAWCEIPTFTDKE